MDIVVDEKLMRGKKPAVPYGNGWWVAGGAVRRWFTGEKQDSDIDVFCADDESEKRFIDEAKLSKPTHKGDRVTTYGKIQVIHLRFRSPAECINHFDFHHCMFAYDGDKVYSTTEAVCAALRKHLSINAVQSGYELDTLRRAFKYHACGYKPCIGTLRDMMTSFSKLTAETVEQQAQMSPGGGLRWNVRWD